MALVTVKVQGSDNATQDVLLDTITGQVYAMPIYKLAIGAEGADDGVISAANPLPITHDALAELAAAINSSRLDVNLAATGVTQPISHAALNIDGVTNALRTINYVHHKVHDGSHFYVQGTQDIANGANLDFIWSVPDTTKWPHALWEIDGEGELTMSMYEDVTTSNDGSPLTIFNNNRNSGTAAGVGGFKSPTLAGGTLGDEGQGGTLVWQQMLGSGKKIGGQAGRHHEFIGLQNSKYWFRINNATAGTLWVNYDFHWYENSSL